MRWFWLAMVCACVNVLAELVVYSPYPAQIERDWAYRVDVTQGDKTARLDVINHCEKSILESRTFGGDVNRRFCEFAFQGEPVRVDIKVTEDVKCYKVFPARHNLKTTFKDGVISVWLNEPCYFGIQLNDYDKTILSVFADKPEDPVAIPEKGKPGVLYVEGWLDAEGKNGLLTIPKDIHEIYIAPGAVLNARIFANRWKEDDKPLKIHGRGIVLDPLSDIFRYDQTANTMRGLVRLSGNNYTVDGIKLVDARTFNFMSWGKNIKFTNVKIMSSMMCSDGFTNGGSNTVVDNAWLYVGDNAIVVSGLKDSVYRNVAIGTSCAAIFPQNSNLNVAMENIDVFRVDEGLLRNAYNGALRRNNKWTEMSGKKQEAEPGPQDLVHQTNSMTFKSLSAIDTTRMSFFFEGRNMGTKPKEFTFDGVSLPHCTGSTNWRDAGKRGRAFVVHNDPKKWLITDNYLVTINNLFLDGQPADGFDPDHVVGVKEGLAQLKVTRDDKSPVKVPLKPLRYQVDWTCPNKLYIGHALQRDWRKTAELKTTVRKPETNRDENLLADNPSTRSIWQRVPSWSVKFEAMGMDGSSRVYRLVQCERNAGMHAIITDAFLRHGNGLYKLSFKAKTADPTILTAIFRTNEERTPHAFPLMTSGEWVDCHADFEVNFDLDKTDLCSLAILSASASAEICFKDLRLVKSQ